MVLDIQEYEERPSDQIEGFSSRLVELMPTLREHGCSIGKPDGFIQRLQNGTWAGHIVEHIAIELQCLAGMEVGFGKTRGTSIDGVYIVVFRYLVESVGLKAAQDAVSIFEAVVAEKNVDIDQVILALKILREGEMLGPTTWSIVKRSQIERDSFYSNSMKIAIFNWAMVLIKSEFKPPSPVKLLPLRLKLPMKRQE